MIPSPKELLAKSIFNDKAIIEETSKVITKALLAKADHRISTQFSITVELAVERKELVRRLLSEAGYAVRALQTGSHRNESYISVDLMIPPQGA